MLLQLEGRPLHAEFVLIDAAVDAAQRLTLRFEDVRLALGITLDWTLDAAGIVTCRGRLDNRGGTEVAVLRFASLALPLPAWAQQVTRYTGRWAAEMQAVRSPIAHGVQGAMSFEGRPSHAGGHWLLIEEPYTDETHGLALGAHLAWSGDHEVLLERDADGARLLMSARLDAGEVRASGRLNKITCQLKEGITQDQAKKLAKLIRDEGPKKVKTQVQGDELRVSSPSRDDLQEVIQLVKDADLDFPVQFVNYR